jgi:hypothetical protein
MKEKDYDLSTMARIPKTIRLQCDLSCPGEEEE